jgi:hypothetical protein
MGRKVTAEALLRALSSIGYRKPSRPNEKMDRLDIRRMFEGFEWVRFDDSAADDEAA